MTREVSDYSVDHHLSDRESNIHRMWDNSLDPILTVTDGDVVRFECRDALDGQLNVESDIEDFENADRGRVHPLTGPVAIENAEQGDVLEVEVLELQHKVGIHGVSPRREGYGASSRRLSGRGYPHPGP